MRALSWLLLMVFVAASLTGCGGTDEEFEDTRIVLRKVENGEAETLELESGARVDFPANVFDTDESVTVIFSDELSYADSDEEYYPTETKLATDILAGVVINTPADVLFTQDITSTLVGYEWEEGGGLQPNTEYVVYRFNFAYDDDDVDPRWFRWGDTVAMTNDTGALATVTLPTNGFRGYVGTVALFAGHTLTALGPAAPSVISGNAIDNNGSGIATTVGVYVMVGSQRFPAGVLNGYVPENLPDPAGADNEMITVANTINTATDGSFTIELPDNLIGQVVGLVFGELDDSIDNQDHFDILPPEEPLEDINYLSVRYGENNVISQPVFRAN
jgi:hypothetical protein